MTGQELHDRATRGEKLSAEERVQLDAWYARLDQEEEAILTAAAAPASISLLQSQIQTTVSQLALTTQRIQALTTENVALRQEIASLQQMVAQRLTQQPA